MVLRATCALSCLRCFELSNDFVDRGRSAFDRLRDGAATERTKTLPVSRKIHLRDWNVFPLDIPPDIDLSSIEKGLYTNVFAFCRSRYELAPVFWPLMIVVPFVL